MLTVLYPAPDSIRTYDSPVPSRGTVVKITTFLQHIYIISTKLIYSKWYFLTKIDFFIKKRDDVYKSSLSSNMCFVQKRG